MQRKDKPDKEIHTKPHKLLTKKFTNAAAFVFFALIFYCCLLSKKLEK